MAQILAAATAFVLALAAFVRVLVKAYDSRFDELKTELASVRNELRAEIEKRKLAEALAEDAERRAELAEAQVVSLIGINERMRREIEEQRETIDTMRLALIGSEAERNEALKELARRAEDAARERAANSTEDTAPHRAATTKGT